MNLLTRLRMLIPNEREIDAVLLNACGRCTRRLSQERVEYICASDTRTVYATVKFRRGRIASIDPGPGLQSNAAREDLFRRATEETAPTHGVKIGPRMLLADNDLRGSIKWRDHFRVDPLHASVPTQSKIDWIASTQPYFSGPRAFGPPYPIVLQVTSLASPNSIIEVRRHFQAIETAQNLLALLLIGRIRPFYEDNDRAWALLNSGGGMENHLVHRGFNSWSMPEFYAPVTYEPPTAPDEGYFNRTYGEPPELTVPSSFSADLEAAWALDGNAAAVFRRAAHWFSLGLRHKANPSLALLSFATAVECLLPSSTRPSCATCGAPTGPGPTQLFKRHLVEFGEVPSDLPDLRAQIYDARSALIHGSFSAVTDNIVPTYGGDAEEEYAVVEHVTRTSLINWLRRQRNSPSAA